MQLNAVSRLLLNLLLEKDGSTGRELLTRIAREIGHKEPTLVLDEGEKLLLELKTKDILLGTRPGE